MVFLDPKNFGLSSRDNIVPLSKDRYGLKLERRSRIVMADGRRLFAKVEKIRKVCPDCRVEIMTDAPVCSKTRAWLRERDVVISSTEK